MSSLVHNDPSALLANGAVNPHHTDPNVYTELGLVTLALALVMLGGAWFRKRLVIGIASALYGLSFFNLHYWGFGVPYIMIGAWYMVRAYRLSQKLNWPRPVMPPTQGPGGIRAQPNKRYTPRPPRPAGPQSQPGQGHRSGLSPAPPTGCTGRQAGHILTVARAWPNCRRGSKAARQMGPGAISPR